MPGRRKAEKVKGYKEVHGEVSSREEQGEGQVVQPRAGKGREVEGSFTFHDMP